MLRAKSVALWTEQTTCQIQGGGKRLEYFCGIAQRNVTALLTYVLLSDGLWGLSLRVSAEVRSEPSFTEIGAGGPQNLRCRNAIRNPNSPSSTRPIQGRMCTVCCVQQKTTYILGKQTPCLRSVVAHPAPTELACNQQNR